MSFTPSSVAPTCSASTASPRARETRQCRGLGHREKVLGWCPPGDVGDEDGWGLVWPRRVGTGGAGLAVGARRAGGTCLVGAARGVVGIGGVAGARVDRARSGLLASGGCRARAVGVEQRLEASCGTAGDGVVMEVLSSTVVGGVVMEVLGSTVDDGMVMEVFSRIADDGTVMEVLGNTVGAGVVMEVSGSPAGDGVMIEVLGSTVVGGALLDALGSTVGGGVVMEVLDSMVGDRVVMEVSGSTVGDGVVMEAPRVTADDRVMMEALDITAGDGAVRKASAGTVGNMEEVAIGNGMAGSAMTGKVTDGSGVCAAVGETPGDSKADVLCDDAEVNGRDGEKETEGGKVAGQINWSSLRDTTACPARWGGVLHDTWADNFTFSLFSWIQLCR